MEVLMLRRLDHKHVIGYYTSFVEKKSLYIVMEYGMLAGDLNCTNSRSLHELDDNYTYHKLNEASEKKTSRVSVHTNNYLQWCALLDGSHKIAQTQEVM